MRVTIEIDSQRSLEIDTDRIRKWDEWVMTGLPAGINLVGVKKKRKRASPSLPTWQSRLMEAFEERNGLGSGRGIGFARLGRAFKGLVDAHGADDVVVAWGNYLDSTEGQFQSPENFVRRYNEFKCLRSAVPTAEEAHAEKVRRVERQAQERS